MSSLVETIDSCFPQTQCQRCGYPNCLDYAKAIAFEDAPINRCPPGGDVSIAALARLLDKEIIPLNTELGDANRRVIAQIREFECIGCAACLKVCPTDTIIGMSKAMHTVVEEECTGCELCLGVCPIDCIDFHPVDSADFPEDGRWPQWRQRQSNRWRQMFQEHQRRKAPKNQPLAANNATPSRNKADIRSEILKALARAKAKKEQP